MGRERQASCYSLSRILSDKVIIKIEEEYFSLSFSTFEDKYKAECLYEELLYDLSFEGWISLEDTKLILMKRGLWDQESDNVMKQLVKIVDNLKVDLFKNFFKKNMQDDVRKKLNLNRNSLLKLQARRHSLDYVTLENYVSNLKFQYLTALSIRNSSNQPVYTDKTFWLKDSYILTCVLTYLNDNKIDSNEIRTLARNEVWRSYWNIGKERVFNKPVLELSEEQKMLALYSKMYDNAYNHPDCPPDDIIDDDDAFDGWMIMQDRKRKQEIAKKTTENIVDNKQKNAGEIFIPVGSKEDAKRVHQMNDLQTRMEQKQRQKVIAAQGRVQEQDLPDVKMKLQQQAVKQFVSKVKGK